MRPRQLKRKTAAPDSGTVRANNYGSGDSVAKGDVLHVIGYHSLSRVIQSFNVIETLKNYMVDYYLR